VGLGGEGREGKWGMYVPIGWVRIYFIFSPSRKVVEMR
jgi:hypothetical protein